MRENRNGVDTGGDSMTLTTLLPEDELPEEEYDEDRDYEQRRDYQEYLIRKEKDANKARKNTRSSS